MFGGGGGDGVVVLARVGDEELGGVEAAPLYLFSCGTAFRATAPIISPGIW